MRSGVPVSETADTDFGIAVPGAVSVTPWARALTAPRAHHTPGSRAVARAPVWRRWEVGSRAYGEAKPSFTLRLTEASRHCSETIAEHRLWTDRQIRGPCPDRVTADPTRSTFDDPPAPHAARRGGPRGRGGLRAPARVRSRPHRSAPSTASARLARPGRRSAPTPPVWALPRLYSLLQVTGPCTWI